MPPSHPAGAEGAPFWPDRRPVVSALAYHIRAGARTAARRPGAGVMRRRSPVLPVLHDVALVAVPLQAAGLVQFAPDLVGFGPRLSAGRERAEPAPVVVSLPVDDADHEVTSHRLSPTLSRPAARAPGAGWPGARSCGAPSPTGRRSRREPPAARP